MLEVLLLIPLWGQMHGVVVRDKDLFVALDVPLGHDGHDESEPRVVQGLKHRVVDKGVAALVPQAGTVPVQAGVVLGNVQTEHPVHINLVIRKHMSTMKFNINSISPQKQL